MVKPTSLLTDWIVNARFSTTSSVFRLIVNETANCTMEQYSWAIPLDLDITNPKYLVGLFNASVDRGTYDIDLYGWEAWSPFFYVREESASSSTATGISTTTLLSETGEPRPTPSATPPLTSSSTSSTSSSTASPTATSSDSDSTDVKIGVGVGVGVGGAIILALLLAWFFVRRRKKSRQGQVGPAMAMPPPAQTGPAELTGSGVAEAPAKPKRTVYEMQG